ncbi:helix-turn-helix transcriptional regulator [Parapedobacter tibetensis]|uniref:helix-turn-helix transcriptional regulator n=1 Tax=Parapedobacter tibetensis TaxID=2972951 RepID=UPI00214DF0D7|nr:AraC family transcriptional regulator [Parapedobacter tibetensis]
MNEYFTTDHYRLVYPNTMPPHYDYVDNPPDVFLPMSDPLPVRGVRGPEGDAVLQYLEDEQVFFGYFQTLCKKPYKLLFDSFDDCCLLVFCIQGTIQWEVGYQDELLSTPQGYTLGFPITQGLSRIHFDKGFHRCYFIGLKGDFAKLASYQYYMIGSMHDHMSWASSAYAALPPGKLSKASLDLLAEQIASPNKKQLGAILELKSRVYTLLGAYHDQVLAYYKGGGMPINERIRLQAKRYIEQHYTNPDLTADEIAAQLFVSRSLLFKAFAETREKVLDLIKIYRMHKASELLRASRLPIADIGALTGYFTTTTFNRVFKETFFMTPTEFRQEKRKKR